MEPRVIEIEKKIAFQEHLLAEMNEALIHQQQQIDTLERQLKAFQDQAASTEWIRRPEEEPPPPHY